MDAHGADTASRVVAPARVGSSSTISFLEAAMGTGAGTFCPPWAFRRDPQALSGRLG